MTDTVTPLATRDLAGADGEALLALNNDHAVELSWLEAQRLAHLVGEAFVARRVGVATPCC
jgi:predicted GNAT superfamily acetyltransferase